MRASWLFLCLLGCGSVTNHLPDGPPGGDDDALTDAPTTVVKVTALTTSGNGLPDPKATVVFADSAGVLISDSPVDANGKAQAEMPNGGTVFVIRTTEDDVKILSGEVEAITSVKPGDDLTAGVKATTVDGTAAVDTMTATYAAPNGAQRIDFYTRCGPISADPAGGTVQLMLPASCRGAKFDLLMVASGQSLQHPVFTLMKDLTFVAGANIQVLTTTTAMQDFTLTVSNVDTNVSALTGTRAALVDGAEFAPQSAAVTGPVAGTNTVKVPFAQGFGTAALVGVAYTRSDATSQQRSEFLTTDVQSAGTLDVATLRHPWYSSLAQSTAGITWSKVADGNPADAMVIVQSSSWTVVNTQVQVQWFVYGEQSDTGMALPALPSKYARFDPRQQTNVTLSRIGIMAAVNYPQFDGYDGLRQQARTLLNPNGDLSTVGQFAGMATQRAITVMIPRLGVQ